jgi:hypothetical protein
MDARRRLFAARAALLSLAALIVAGLWQGYGVLLAGSHVR